jgi:uncharacterized membrane protein YbhN (UPF0104 family)
VDYLTVAAAYILANLAGIASHAPGGLGVIEAVFVVLFPNTDIIGPLIAFRVVYFLCPLGGGIVLFGASELWQRFEKARHERVLQRTQ